MSKPGALPDAWDDDWVNVADKPATVTHSAPPLKVSRAERKAQHQAANKQIWQAAEEPERFHFLETKGAALPVVTADFKPAVKVLSRKPQIAKPSTDSAAAIAGLNLDDGDDSEEEDRKNKARDFAERQRRAQVEREEKQRKYNEARERLFGSAPPAAPSRDSPSANQVRNPTHVDYRNLSRRGRARAADTSGHSSATPSPARNAAQPKQLYDPNYEVKTKSISPRPQAAREEQIIRAPRGPDNSGRGGFGFAPRGRAPHP